MAAVVAVADVTTACWRRGRSALLSPAQDGRAQSRVPTIGVAGRPTRLGAVGLYSGAPDL